MALSFFHGCGGNITAFGVNPAYAGTERGTIKRGLTMKKLLSATAALAFVALTAPANAADLPVKAPPIVMPALYNWNGLYIGIEAGAVMGQNSDWFFNTPGCTPGIGVCANVGHPLHGGFVGGEAGFNWQAPGSRWVFGIEGDGQWAELEEALTCPAPFFAFSCGSRIRDFETVRGRIGYVFGPTGSFLVFVTGGWATASQSAFFKPGSPPFDVPGDEQFVRHNGFAVGGGAEYGITPWLSLKGEVIYVWLQGKDHCIPSVDGCPTTNTIRVKDDFVLARMALNWRFNWGKGKGPGPVVARY